MKQEKSKAYKKYIELLQKGGSMPYLDENEWEDIIYDFNDDFNIQSSRVALAEALRQHPSSEILQKIHVLLLIEEKRAKEARLALQPFLDDGSFETIKLKFGLSTIEKKSKQGIKELIKALRKGQITPLDFTDMINDFWDDIDKESAHDAAASLLDDFGNDALAYVELGIILADTDDLIQAAIAQEKALDIDAYNMKAWHNLMRCYFETGQYERCKECCDFALAIDVNSPIMHFTRAFIFCQNEQWEEGCKDLEAVLELILSMREKNTLIEEYATEEDALQQENTAVEMLANCYSNLGERQKALDSYLAFQKRKPNNADVTFNIACLLMDMGNYNDALEQIDYAIYLCPRKTSFLAMKASMLTSMHRFDEAFEVLNRLIRIAPKTNTYLMAKAQLAIHLNRQEEADTAFRQLLRLHPKDETIRQLMRSYFEAIGDKDALEEL